MSGAVDVVLTHVHRCNPLLRARLELERERAAHESDDQQHVDLRQQHVDQQQHVAPARAGRPKDRP